MGQWSVATHGRRVATYVVLLAVCGVVFAWFLADPSDPGYRFGKWLSPVGLLLFGALLVYELRKGRKEG